MLSIKLHKLYIGLFNAHDNLSLRSSRTLVKGLGLKDGLRGGGGVDHRPEVKSIFQVRCNLSNTIISI